MGADQHIDWMATTASALDWWREAGVDTLVEDQPRDWLAPAVASPRAEPAAAIAAPAAATMPATLDAFLSWRVSATAPDFGWGPMIPPAGKLDSDLMVLLDMPERDDSPDSGLLTGPAGTLFDRMLAAIGRDRGSILLASLVAARPVSGRIDPAMTAPLVAITRHLIGLARPKRLLVMGDAANRALLETSAAATSPSFHVVNHEHGTIEAVATFHPRFLLAQPGQKARAWRDLQMVIGGIGQ